MPFFIAVPLCGLTVLSIFSGYFLSDMFIGIGSNFFCDVFPASKINNSVVSEQLPVFLKLLPTYLSALGFVLGINYDVIFLNSGLNRLVLSKQTNCAFNLDSLYNRGVVMPFCKFALVFCFRLIDKYILEWLGPKGLFHGLQL